MCGLSYQRHKEKRSAPIQPPNRDCWNATRRAGRFLYEQLCAGRTRFAACNGHSDDHGGLPTTVQNCNAHTDSLYTQQNDDPDDVSVNELGGNEDLRARGTPASNIRSETLASRVRLNLDSFKNWVVNAAGLRNRSSFAANYQSFPRYPEEDGDGELLENDGSGDEGEARSVLPVAEQLQNPVEGESESPNSPSIGSRLSQSWISLCTTVASATSSSSAWRRGLFSKRILLTEEDAEEDAISSASSNEAEVDRRAVGIFGTDAVDHTSSTRTKDTEGSTEDDCHFEDAAEGDLCDRPADNFGSSQLAFQ